MGITSYGSLYILGDFIPRMSTTPYRSGHQDQVQRGSLPRRPRLHSVEGCDEDGSEASRGSPTGVQEKGRAKKQ